MKEFPLEMLEKIYRERVSDIRSRYIHVRGELFEGLRRGKSVTFKIKDREIYDDFIDLFLSNYAGKYIHESQRQSTFFQDNIIRMEVRQLRSDDWVGINLNVIDNRFFFPKSFYTSPDTIEDILDFAIDNSLNPHLSRFSDI